MLFGDNTNLCDRGPGEPMNFDDHAEEILNKDTAILNFPCPFIYTGFQQLTS